MIAKLFVLFGRNLTYIWDWTQISQLVFTGRNSNISFSVLKCNGFENSYLGRSSNSIAVNPKNISNYFDCVQRRFHHTFTLPVINNTQFSPCFEGRCIWSWLAKNEKSNGIVQILKITEKAESWYQHYNLIQKCLKSADMLRYCKPTFMEGSTCKVT